MGLIILPTMTKNKGYSDLVKSRVKHTHLFQVLLTATAQLSFFLTYIKTLRNFILET